MILTDKGMAGFDQFFYERCDLGRGRRGEFFFQQFYIGH